MESRGGAGAEPAASDLTRGWQGGEWLHRPELCDAVGRARTPIGEDGGGEEDIKREAGRAPRQKEQSSGPAWSGYATGTLGRAPGCVKK